MVGRCVGVAVAAASVALLAGCARGPVTAASRRPSLTAGGMQIDLTGVVPWIHAPTQPGPVPTPPPPPPRPTDARPCGSDDVHASMGRGDGAGGHILFQVAFHNVSSSKCVLSGYPSVVASETGQPDVTGQDGSFFAAGTTANMPPGDNTFLGLETDTYWADRPGGGGGRAPYHHLVIGLPGGGTVVLDAAEGLDVTCGLHLTRFYVPEPEQPEPPSPLRSLTAAIEAPDNVTAGSTLGYVVDLTNRSNQPVPLEPCPAYLQAAPLPTPVKDIEALNCAAAGSLPAHGTVRFEMRMPIPADAPAGEVKIFWELIGPDLARVASVDITVAAAPTDTPS